jgi:hypothetical protein
MLLHPDLVDLLVYLARVFRRTRSRGAYLPSRQISMPHQSNWRTCRVSLDLNRARPLIPKDALHPARRHFFVRSVTYSADCCSCSEETSLSRRPTGWTGSQGRYTTASARWQKRKIRQSHISSPSHDGQYLIVTKSQTRA